MEIMGNMSSNSHEIKCMLSDFSQYKTRIEMRLDSLADIVRQQGDQVEKVAGRNPTMNVKSSSFASDSNAVVTQ